MTRCIVANAIFLLLTVGVFFPPLYGGFCRGLSWSFELQRPPLGREYNDTTALYREGFVAGEGITRNVHCPSLTELGDGNLFAVWYGGEREGASDVALYHSAWNERTGAWTSPCLLIDAPQTQAALRRYVRKVGNAVLIEDFYGRLWLFYVSVSVGGWSGSAVNFMVSRDGGSHWSKPRRLVTSPIFNMGTLVKGAPVLYADGSIGLPVYHELCGKWSELVRIGTDGRVLHASPITHNRVLLQPSIVPLGIKSAIAFMRNSGEASRRVFLARTSDGGRTWSVPERMPFPNPDSAVAGLRGRDGCVWLVFNNMDVDRDDLSLAGSRDGGKTWRVMHIFEQDIAPVDGEESQGFCYPYFIQARDGLFHLLYTWHRKRIKHVSFNQSWLDDLS